jgi:large subunit ribosomal protein L25
MSKALVAEVRSDFGKGAARKTRREGKVPAVIYGHGSAPIHVALDAHELTQALRHKATSLEVSVDGKTQTVAPRDIQIEPVRRFIEHVDLVVVTAAEAAAIAREAAEASARADAAAEAAANAAAEKAAARAARQAEGDEAAPAAEAAAEEAPAEGDAE